MSTSRETIRGQQRTDESRKRLGTYVIYAMSTKAQVMSAQLIAASEEGAIARFRGTLTHGQPDPMSWLNGYYHVAAHYPGELNNQNPYPEATDNAVAAWVDSIDPCGEEFAAWVLKYGEV